MNIPRTWWTKAVRKAGRPLLPCETNAAIARRMLDRAILRSQQAKAAAENAAGRIKQSANKYD